MQNAYAHQVAEVRGQLDRQLGEIAKVLPKHIPAERFGRTILTAIQQTPELLDVDRRSLWNACMRAAQDGLLPDGRSGAIVIYKDKRRQTKMAQWLPMVAGLRQKVRNSGEIADWNAHVVRERDAWDYEEGDNPHILHKPARGDRGAIVAAYSIARFRTGEISREWMWIEDLDKVRAVSRAERGPWADWPEEMYRKTVLKRHAKSLPMSTDLDDLLRRPDEPSGDSNSAGTVTPLAAVTGQATPPAALSDALDMIAANTNAARSTVTKEPGKSDDDFDADTGEVIDAGEYAESDSEEDQLPLDDKDARRAAEQQR